MPIYEYRCQSCGKKFDALRLFSQADFRLHAGIARVQIHTALSALASRIHRVGTDRPQLPQEEVAEAAAEVHAGHADIKQNGGHLTAILLYLSRLCGFFFFSAFRKSSVQGFDIFLYKE